jgi:hypothetical protein
MLSFSDLRVYADFGSGFVLLIYNFQYPQGSGVCQGGQPVYNPAGRFFFLPTSYGIWRVGISDEAHL